MAAKIPDAFRDLFGKKALAHLATLMPDGSPQTSPVWCDFDGDCVLVNTERKRLKLKNVQRDPRVALSISDPDNPYRYLEVRGRVVETTEKGADALIDKLAKRYMGVDKYPLNKPGDVRVTLRIRPERVSSMG
jgi:PPOX class probable F420-dependent enzyme